MATQDVGGGVQLVDFGKSLGGDPLEQAQKVYSLVDLANRIQLAPLQKQAQEMENQLRKAQVDLIPLNQQKAQFEFEAAKAGERRANASAYFGHLDQVAQAFNQDFEQGQYALSQIIPGARAKRLDSGAVSIVAPNANGQGVSSFKIFPGAATRDPKDVAQNEQNLRAAWLKASEPFVEMDQQYRAMQKYSALETGAGDLAMIIAYAKVLDPRSVVREGELVMAQETGSVGQSLTNLYNQVKNGQKLDPTLRKNLTDAADIRVSIARDDLKSHASAAGQVWKTAGYDPRKIYTPVGSLNVFATEKQDGGAGDQTNEQGAGTSAQGAGSAGVRKAPAGNARVPQSPPQADEATAAASPAPATGGTKAPPARIDLKSLTSGALQRMKPKKPGEE